MSLAGSDHASLAFSLSASSATPPGCRSASRSPRGGATELVSPREGATHGSPLGGVLLAGAGGLHGVAEAVSPRGGNQRSPRGLSPRGLSPRGLSPRGRAALEAMLTPLNSSRSKLANKIHSAREPNSHQERMQSVSSLQGLAGGGAAFGPYDTGGHTHPAARSFAGPRESPTPHHAAGDAPRPVTVVPADGFRQLLEELLREQAESIVREVRAELELKDTRRELAGALGKDEQRVERGVAEDGSVQYVLHKGAQVDRGARGGDERPLGPSGSHSSAGMAPEVFRSKDRLPPHHSNSTDTLGQQPTGNMSFKDMVFNALEGHHMDYMNQTLHRVDDCFEWWQNLEEKPRYRTVDIIVRSRLFQIVTLAVITLNMAFLAAALNYEIEAGKDFVNDSLLALVVKYVFMIYYCAELALRMISEGKYFWFGRNMGWNVFDSAVILGSLVGELLQSSNATFLRSLRFFKVFKVGRMMPALRWVGFGELAMMTSQVMGSLTSLFWCLVLLAFITFIFAVYFMQAFVHSDFTAKNSPIVAANWSSVSQSMLTLLMSTTGGREWADTYNELDVLSGFNRSIFLAYVLFSFIAIWNIVTSTFLNKALNLGKADNEALAAEDRLSEHKDEKKLRKLLRQADVDHSAEIDEHEFASFVRNDEFRAFLASRGIDIKEATTFFQMLVEASGGPGLERRVDIDAVVSSCMRIKGQATSIDLYTMRYEMRSLIKAQNKALRRLERVVEADYKVVGSPFHHDEPSVRNNVNGQLTL